MRTTDGNQRRNDDEIDLRLLFQEIRRNWHYFLFSAILFSIAALLYIRFTLPVYEARSSVLVKDTKNTSKNIEDIFTGDLFGNTKNIATEIGILKSRSILDETIHELNLQVSYFSHSPFFKVPLYKNHPFSVEPLNVTEGIYDEKFELIILDSSRFRLETDIDNSHLKNFSYTGTHRFGEEIKNTYFSFRIDKQPVPANSSTDDEYIFVVNSNNKLISAYQESIKAEPLNKDATIVEITIQDQIPERAVDFLNTLGKVYINRDIKDKSSVAGLTLKFVDEQLADISTTLHSTEQELQKFKEEKGTVNLSEESKAYLERVTSIDADRVKAEIELESLDYLYDYVSGNKTLSQLAPASLGTPDPLLIELITQLKQLQNKKQSLQYGSSSQSPAILVIDEQISETKKALVENINNIRNRTRVTLQGINGQLLQYENNIRKIPNIERELLGIQRNFSVNENIYLYLLQKKAETGIAKATAVSDNKVLDEASLNDKPVIPSTKAVLIISLMLAFFVPLIILLLRGYLKNTISNREDVEKLTKIPIIGVVGHLSDGERLIVARKPKSSIAEAFRSIRANLMFFGLADEHKIVMITSSVGGEGKSFSTLNLATVLSLQNHKVVIVGMDLRKPQLVQDLEISNDKGVSTYLIGKISLDEVICKTKIENLDIIPSGPVPPNPAELLAKKETRELLEKLKHRYDYIIIDTPPVGIVSDAMLLMGLADVNVFILRENYSKKQYIKTINEYYKDGKVKNLCILLNDAGLNQQYGYGYGYSYGYHGYGYYDEDKKKAGFFNRIFGKT
ncbi:MAG: polysaccharide biosynthesis tyrosine autokinase [Bacteroidetes bacterium]|nr:MAG: polysaccharide biosynthesis tyrosine autokinase [Bacteroidota bacterium]